LTPYTIEACVETTAEAVAAQKEGAHQIELCSQLDLDGLTPDITMTQKILHQLSIPVKVMIRPRSGNFIYDKAEVDQMYHAISEFKKLPIFGVVIGALTKENRLNVPLIKSLVRAAVPLNVTIHKAIDTSSHPLTDLKLLKKIPGVNSLLSSGGAPTALEGKNLLKAMIEEASGEITIIAAGKITLTNLPQIHQEVGAKAYHGRQIVGQLF